MKTHLRPLAVILSAGLLAAVQTMPALPPGQLLPGVIEADSFDLQFVSSATQAGLKQVELSRHAAGKATTPEIKQFAATLVADHSKANEELKQLAQAKGIQIPGALEDGQQDIINRVNKQTGAGFDQEYIAEMISDHKKSIKLFEDGLLKLQDGPMKAFATKTLPVLKHHLQEAEALEKRPQ